MSSRSPEKNYMLNDLKWDESMYGRIRGLSLDYFPFDDIIKVSPEQKTGSIIKSEFDVELQREVTDLSSSEALIWRVEHERGMSFDFFNLQEVDDIVVPKQSSHSLGDGKILHEIDSLSMKRPRSNSISSTFSSRNNFCKEEEAILNSYEEMRMMENLANEVDSVSTSFSGLSFNEKPNVDFDAHDGFSWLKNHSDASLSPALVGPAMHSSVAQSNDTLKIEPQTAEKAHKVGAYTLEERALRIARFHSKRASRIWRKKIKYDCRKKLADSRPRLKGRFVTAKEMNNALKLAANSITSSMSDSLQIAKDTINTKSINRNPHRSGTQGDLRCVVPLSAEDTASFSSDSDERFFKNSQSNSCTDQSNKTLYLGRGGRLAARRAAKQYNSS